MADLTGGSGPFNGLATANQHLYASWSMQDLYANVGERHLAIWPNGENPEANQPYTIGNPASDLPVASYMIAAWEDASNSTVRAQDDTPANLAWLQLYEATRSRLRVQANTNLGEVSTSGYTRYEGGQLGLANSLRFFHISFTVRSVASFT